MSFQDLGFNTLISISHREAIDTGPNNRASNRELLDRKSTRLNSSHRT